MLYLKNPFRHFKHILIAPLLWLCVFPIVLTDLAVEIYHRVSFPLYGIPIVKRSSYIRIDRHKLSYLNFPQKLYCVYCGYVNGVIAYWGKIAADTEAYWCGVQHDIDPNFIPLDHQKDYPLYGDKDNFKKKYYNK